MFKWVWLCKIKKVLEFIETNYTFSCSIFHCSAIGVQCYFVVVKTIDNIINIGGQWREPLPMLIESHIANNQSHSLLNHTQMCNISQIIVFQSITNKLTHDFSLNIKQSWTLLPYIWATYSCTNILHRWEIKMHLHCTVSLQLLLIFKIQYQYDDCSLGWLDDQCVNWPPSSSTTILGK